VAKSDVELNLLLEGLAKFQNERQATDPKSWFQIAGEWRLGRLLRFCMLTFWRHPWKAVYDLAE
jgi:hypothetical protein